MADDGDHAAASTRERALTEYPRDVASMLATSYFHRALQALDKLSTAAAMQLFNGRAHRVTVRNWIIGRRQPPPWAIDTVRQALRERVERDLAITNQNVVRLPGRREAASRLASLRRAKEKARREAGQSGQT